MPGDRLRVMLETEWPSSLKRRRIAACARRLFARRVFAARILFEIAGHIFCPA